VGCGTYDAESRALYQEALAARPGEAGLRRVEELRRRMAGAAGAQGDGLLAALGRLMEEAQAYDALPETGDPVRVDRQGHEETWGDVLRLQAEGVEPAAFAAITCPVLMLHGDDDPHPGPATFALLRRYVPQLRYRGFPRCGHRPWVERHAREPFLAALREWLAAPGERSTGPAA